MIWIYLNGKPARQFYRDPRAASLLSTLIARHEVLKSVSPLRDDATGETSNLTIELDNRGRALTAMFARPPIGDEVTVYDDSSAVFEGIVQRVRLAGDVAVLECVA